MTQKRIINFDTIYSTGLISYYLGNISTTYTSKLIIRFCVIIYIIHNILFFV